MEKQEDLYINFLNSFYGRGLLIHFSYLLSIFGILFLTTWIYFNNYYTPEKYKEKAAVPRQAAMGVPVTQQQQLAEQIQRVQRAQQRVQEAQRQQQRRQQIILGSV